MSSATKPVEQIARELLAKALATKFGLEPAYVAEEMDADPAEWQEACIAAIIAALNTDEERIRREAFEEAADVALSFENKDWESYDPRTIAVAIRSLSTPSKEVGR